MQGHVVIPNPWGNVSTNGDTTTDDTTDKDGGDEEGDCGGGGNCKVGEKLWPYFAGLPGLLEEGIVQLVDSRYVFIIIDADPSHPEYISGYWIGETRMELTEAGENFLASFGVTDRKVLDKFNDFLNDAYWNQRKRIDCEVIMFPNGTCSLRWISSGNGSSITEEFC